MNVTEALATLKESGYKQTGKREEMLAFFSASDKYITAKELLTEMQKEHPGLSFDTIYRNLALFANLGILEETELSGEMHFRYNCATKTHHHHFICLKCGGTKEIHTCPMFRLEEDLQGYSISGHKFEIYGLCPVCV